MSDGKLFHAMGPAMYCPVADTSPGTRENKVIAVTVCKFFINKNTGKIFLKR